MKKKYLILFLFIALFSCKSTLYNIALERIGAYDEKVSIETITHNNKQVVFLPMVHLSTELFYQDVVKKVDSLKKDGFVFYYEHIKAEISQDTILRKVRKIRGVPYSKNGYKGVFDSVLGDIKFKKKLINQPSYNDLGLMPSYSKNIDATLKEMVAFYETKYEEIILDACDFEAGIYETTKCEDKKIDKLILDDMVINFRNTIVVNEVIKDENKKIAILYGKRHFIGIKKELLNKGFLVTTK